MLRTSIAVGILIGATFFTPVWLQICLYVIFLFVVRYRIALVIPALVADAWYAPARDFSIHSNTMLLLAVGMVLVFMAVVRTTRISQRYGLEKK